ncbi:MAG: NAD(P)-dependent oxidoreductase, partial [Alphaproteobacteria bacterium]
MASTPTVLVCGAGSVGRRHIANLRTLGARVHVWRERTHESERLAAELGLPVARDLEGAIAGSDAV